ncbi:hypothetical protein RRG08_042005, partial [Elysia crispata]
LTAPFKAEIAAFFCTFVANDMSIGSSFHDDRALSPSHF